MALDVGGVMGVTKKCISKFVSKLCARLSPGAPASLSKQHEVAAAASLSLAEEGAGPVAMTTLHFAAVSQKGHRRVGPSW